MARRLDWEKDKRKPAFEWVKWDPVQKAHHRRKLGWNAQTWQAARARLQALADAAAPTGDGGNSD